jgi:hypothetical protein
MFRAVAALGYLDTMSPISLNARGWTLSISDIVLSSYTLINKSHESRLVYQVVV